MEIPISKDIRKVKTKDVGNFSFKQAGFIALGAGVGGLAYFLFGTLEMAVIPALLVIAFGFLKPYGMTMTQFFRTVGKEKLSPSTYIYETDFVYDYDYLLEQYGKDYNVVIPDDLIQSASDNDIKTTTTKSVKKGTSKRTVAPMQTFLDEDLIR